MTQLNILALADIHYIGTADHTCKLHRRKSKLALEFVQRVLDSVDIQTIDVIALMGDLVDNGNAPGADNDLEALRSNLVKCGKPIIVIPGNHDAIPRVVLDMFGDHEGLHEIKGYQLVTFVDKYGKDDAAERNLGKMKSVFSKLDSTRPIIVMQHSPIYPPIDSPYPYNIKNAEEVMKFYTNEGVTLSISGHAHWGITTVVQDNVSYMTCPALCEDPYRYCLISLKGKDFEVKEQSLAFRNIALSDLHIHTHFAYCSVQMDPVQCIDRANELGLQRIAFTEHAGQLYMSREDYWSSNFVNVPGMIMKNKNTQWNRMKKYREEIGKYRSSNVLLGLELEVDCTGSLTLLEEDRFDWDLWIGAVHYLPKNFEKGSKKGFIQATEALLRNGVDILAHPFRYFVRNKLPVPGELYKPVAEMLSFYNTAVELNYHTYTNDPTFFIICMEHGIPISLGSDAHLIYQVAQLTTHIEFLKSFCPQDKLPDILYSWKR